MALKRISFGSHFLSSKKKDDLKDLFQSFDKDNDGRVSFSEFNDILQSMNVSRSISIQSKAMNKEDSLDFENFAKLMRPTLSDPNKMTKKQQELREAFDAFDTNEDGTIDKHELKAMMENLGDKISVEEAEMLIKEVDLDNDGAVNFDEFSTMMGISTTKQVQIKKPERRHHRLSIKRLFSKHK